MQYTPLRDPYALKEINYNHMKAFLNNPTSYWAFCSDDSPVLIFLGKCDLDKLQNYWNDVGNGRLVSTAPFLG